MNDYTARNSVCHRLGYRSYKKYLLSPLWRQIKKRVCKPGTECVVCEREATEVHHKEYSEKVLLGEDDSKLVPLCRWCHQFLEFDDRGEKRTLDQANSVLEMMLHCAL